MEKQLPESKKQNLRRTTNFIVIFLIVFLFQIPGCVVVFADDAGQIDETKHEKLIQFSTATFAFPLRLVMSATDSWSSLIFVYVSNIILLSCFVFFLIFIWKKVKKRML